MSVLCLLKFKVGSCNSISLLLYGSPFIHRDRQKLSLELGTAENLWWKSNFKQICFQFFTKDVYSFTIFNRNNLIIINI